MMQKLLWIGLAGILGTLARYGLQGYVQRLSGSAFPWGTLAVNGIGCFLFGLVWSLTEERFLIDGTLRIVLLVGFMGAFTTFSTFAFETGQLIRDSEWLLMAANLLAQNLLGLAAVFLGMKIGRFF